VQALEHQLDDALGAELLDVRRPGELGHLSLHVRNGITHEDRLSGA
jgi:hypothetical protein